MIELLELQIYIPIVDNTREKGVLKLFCSKREGVPCAWVSLSFCIGASSS